MTTHLVVGAGPVGTAVARELVALGHDVVLASRSGRGVDVPGAVRTALDASDAAAVTRLAAGAAVVVNAVNPPDYHRWPQLWPPVAAALLAAAEDAGAVLATVSNLYPYGRPTGPMSETSPLQPADVKGEVRLRMWRDALAAHEAGRVRVVEVRASDFIGAGTGANSHTARLTRFVLSGRRAQVVGSPDLPHSWTHTVDTARTLVAAALDPGAHGRAWHVPTNPPRTQRELAGDLAATAGVPAVPVSGVPTIALRLAGIGDGRMRAVADSSYQFRTPFVIDDTAARARFGLRPTPWADVLEATVADVRHELAAAGAR
ncbi:MAG: NAD-dependent epimerase/dehydratase family protein [Kineosporiaceae bacterium]